MVEKGQTLQQAKVVRAEKTEVLDGGFVLNGKLYLTMMDNVSAKIVCVEKDGEINSAPTGTNTDGKAAEVQDAELEVNGKKYVVRELASQEMKNSAGATWDAATAGNAIGTWSSSFGDSIDVVVSNLSLIHI